MKSLAERTSLSRADVLDDDDTRCLRRRLGGVDRDRREVVLRGDREVGSDDFQRSLTAPRNDATIPAASVATSVTSASPIISAAAVDAVRCGLRREFSVRCAPSIHPARRRGTRRATRDASVLPRAEHITSTTRRTIGLISAPSRNAPIRCAGLPGPQAPQRRSQYGSVKNGQTSTLSRNTDQRAIGDISDASAGIRRVVTRATPKKTSSTPTPIQRSTLVVPSPGTKRP